MDQAEQFVAVMVAALALGVLVGTISSYISVEFYHRHTKYRLAQQEAEIGLKNELLAEQAAIQLNRANELRVREEAVTEAEAAIKQRADQAVAALYATSQEFDEDTVENDLDWEKMPELPVGLNDTVMLPRVEDDWARDEDGYLK